MLSRRGKRKEGEREGVGGFGILENSICLFYNFIRV